MEENNRNNNINFINKDGEFMFDKFYNADITDIAGDVILLCDRKIPQVHFVYLKDGHEFDLGHNFILHFNPTSINDVYDGHYRLNCRKTNDDVYYYYVRDKDTYLHYIIRINQNRITPIQLGEFGINDIVNGTSEVYATYRDYKKDAQSLIFLIENKEKIISNVTDYIFHKNVYGELIDAKDEEDYYAHPYMLVKVMGKGYNFLDENGEFIYKGERWFNKASFVKPINNQENPIGVVKRGKKDMVLGVDGKLYEYTYHGKCGDRIIDDVYYSRKVTETIYIVCVNDPDLGEYNLIDIEKENPFVFEKGFKSIDKFAPDIELYKNLPYPYVVCENDKGKLRLFRINNGVQIVGDENVSYDTYALLRNNRVIFYNRNEMNDMIIHFEKDKEEIEYKNYTHS